MKEKVKIFIQDKYAGDLQVDEYGTLCFQYDQEYLSKGGMPISESMPLTAEEYYGGVAHAFFTGLLPEEEILYSIANAIGTSASNNFKLLIELGKECIGAIQVGEIFDVESKDYTKLSLTDFQEIIANQNNLLPFLYKNKNVRLSMAGAQSKVGLLYEDGNYFLPKNGAPSNVIVKPSNQRFDDLIYNEYATMKIAHGVGIETPRLKIISSISPCVYVIHRYDRITMKGGTIKRVHQEDFCQAIGIQTRNKYEIDGGPDFKTCIELIRNACTIPAFDLKKFTSLFLFNFIIGNRDAHGKNYSLIREKNKIQLAPAYDLVSTSYYDTLNSDMSMSINGKFDAGDVTLKDLKDMSISAQISAPLLIKEYHRMKDAILKQSKDVLKEKCFPEVFKQKFARHLESTINKLPV
ncbi:type II toxin-antitoxin system HipA family toxin [bacterium]|nr:type II toxin-antitoxin system HipA family toxin [bacterium]